MSQCMQNDFEDLEDQDCTAADEAVEAHPQLGQCLAEFRGDITRNGSWLMSLLAGIVVCFGLFGYMVHNDGFWPKDQGLAIGQLVMAALGVVCAVLLVLAIRNANSKFQFFEKGLIARRGKQLAEFQWDDILSVTEGMSVTTYNEGVAKQTKHKVTFRLAGGREVKLDLSSVPESQHVSTMIAAATMPRLVGETKAALAAGQTVDFGYVKLRPEGLERHGDLAATKFLGWRDIAEYTLDNGYLTIKSLKGWKAWVSKPVDEIANIRVLIAFIDHYAGHMPLPGDETVSPEPELAEV